MMENCSCLSSIRVAAINFNPASSFIPSSQRTFFLREENHFTHSQSPTASVNEREQKDEQKAKLVTRMKQNASSTHTTPYLRRQSDQEPNELNEQNLCPSTQSVIKQYNNKKKKFQIFHPPPLFNFASSHRSHIGSGQSVDPHLQPANSGH